MDIRHILDKQSRWRLEKLNEKLENCIGETEIRQAYAESWGEFRDNAYKRMTSPVPSERFSKEDLELFVSGSRADIDVLSSCLEDLAADISQMYNASQDFGTSVRNRTEYYASLITDLRILRENSTNATVFRDCLTDYTFIDVSQNVGSQAIVSTAEGIAHLAVTKQSDFSSSISEVRISGNGEEGRRNLARIIGTNPFLSVGESIIGFESDIDSHGNKESLIDSEPQTWLEYQKIGCESSILPNATAEESGEILSLKIQVVFKTEISFNWLNIIPYIPKNMTTPMTVYSIQISEDGVKYVPLFKDKEILNIPIHMISQRYVLDIGETEIVRYNSQGVFICPRSKVKSIEIILRQNCSYPVMLAGYQYDWVVEKDGVIISRVRQDEERIPEEIRNGIAGKYEL